MKKYTSITHILLIMFLLTALTFLGCGKSRTPLFEVNLEVDFPIQAGLSTLQTHYRYVRNIPTYFEVSMNNEGYNVDDNISVAAGRGLITAQFSDIDYDFLSSISVRVVSRLNPEVNREMFYLDQISLNQGTELRMLSSIAEIRDIIAEEFIDLEIRFNLRSFSPEYIDNKMVFSYAVFEKE